MNPNQAAEALGVDPKDVRKYARKHFIKEGKNWTFTTEQVEEMRKSLQFPGSSRTVATANPPKITIQEATEYAKRFLKEEYGLYLTVPIEINKRLTRSLGRFVWKLSTKMPSKIELSQRLVQYESIDVIHDVLKHELIHYACFVEEKPHRDGDHYFENELRRLGVSRTGVIRTNDPRHTYHCSKCGKLAGRKVRKLDLRRFSSGCCKASLDYKGLIQ